MLLARSYEHMGENGSAINAYARAEALGNKDAELAGRIGYSADAVTDPLLPGGSEDSAAFGLEGLLDAPEAVKQLITPSSVVFIMARIDDSTPMPLAVAKYPADSWPIAFKLDQSNLMVQDHSDISGESLILSAKISPDGNAASALTGVSSNKITTSKQATGLNLELILDN